VSLPLGSGSELFLKQCHQETNVEVGEGTGEVPLPGGAVGETSGPSLRSDRKNTGSAAPEFGIGNGQRALEAPDNTPGLRDVAREKFICGITPSFSYDSRDSLFTPNRRSYFEARTGLFSPPGDDDTFQRISLLGMKCLPIHPRLNVCGRIETGFTFGDAPFYTRP
jgi:hypothetical protein